MYFVGANNYIYCSNNPVNFIDPLGLESSLWEDVKTTFSSPSNAVKVWASGMGGSLKGLGNEVVGVAKLAKAATYDQGKVIHDATIGQFTNTMVSEQGRAAQEMSSGDIGQNLKDAYIQQAKDISGYSYGEKIGQDIQHGAETGDWSALSEDAGQIAIMAGGTAYGMSKAKAGNTSSATSNPADEMAVAVEKNVVSTNEYSNNYQKTFADAHPEVKDVVVHHGIEQQAMKRYPGTITEAEMHSLDNLRGIPKEVNSDVHLSKIRKEWNRFYRENPTATAEQLRQKRAEIDTKYGHQFNPPVGKK